MTVMSIFSSSTTMPHRHCCVMMAETATIGCKSNSLEREQTGVLSARKFKVKTTDRTQVREIYAGDSYMSFNSLIAEFGVGNATQIETLQVTWQNGENAETS